MTQPTPEEIRKYWDSKAEALKTDPSATMKDVILRTMEIEAIASRLGQVDDLLDIGCGNAYGTIEFARHCRKVVAVDYSEKMVAAAKQAVELSGQRNIVVMQGSAADIGAAHPGAFTAVSSVRCLINQPTRDEQYLAIEQFSKALVRGGRLFLLEGVADTFEAMNQARQHAGLTSIKLDWHNRLFVGAELERFLERDFRITERVDFGEYYFLSRVVHPLLVAPDEPSFDAGINKIARDIWRAGVARGRLSSMSTLMLYVCEKR